MGKAESLLHEGAPLEQAEEKEKGAADKLGELIKKARPSGGQEKDPKSQSSSSKNPFEPNRAERPSKFKSPDAPSGSWGRLPSAVRRAMLATSKEDVPPEF